MREINKIIIHCSDSDHRSYDFDAIYNDHVNVNGWSNIGYHYGIDHDANIHVLRSVIYNGAHTRGHNKDSIGICVLGRSLFSVAQKEKLADLVSTLLQLTNLDSKDVYPHNYFNKDKTCPNIDIDEWKITYLQDKLWL